MACVINIQHLTASTSYSQVFQSSAPPFIKVHRSILDRGVYRVICNFTTTTHSQGAEAGKSNFKKPKWLLPVQEKANNISEDEVSNRSLFQVILTTSKDYDSSISDLNAGVLLAFIGEDGRCFVHRLSNLVSPHMFETSEQSMELCESRHTPYRFQRGAQDVVTFLGPDVGRLEAVWVAPEQGTWRIQDMTVMVLPEPLDKDSRADSVETGGKILQYDFACEEALIGENGTMSAAELQVSSISEISNEEFLHVDSSMCVSGAQTSLGQVREEGLKEYKALKVSLLSYDALLVVAGSAIAAVAGHKDIAEGYLIGGVLGFLYLFALERAVDQLPAPSHPPSSYNENSSVTSETKTTLGNNSDALYIAERSNSQLAESVNSFRAPLTRLSAILAFSVVIVKAVNISNTQALSKETFFAGAAGFFMTKFATILASNVPLSLKQAESSQGEA